MLKVLSVIGAVCASTPSIAMSVDDGSPLQTGTPIASEVVGLPTIRPASGLQPAGNSVSSLGTFDIVINAGAGLSSNAAALAAFNRAAAQWEAFIADPITVNINADLASLGSGILGSASSSQFGASYNTIRNAMMNDAADEADDAIVGFLPTASQAVFSVPTGFSLTGNIVANRANLNALGFTGLGTGADATITFSTNFSFDYDKSDGVGAGLFDFESVAAHEIGHALGFVSEVDTADFFVDQGQTAALDINPLDLFRFRNGSANDPATSAAFTTSVRSLVPNSPDIMDQVLVSYGDLEVLMSTGDFTGDGNQASHFKDSLSLGIMDPTLAPGEIASITLNDLRAFDLIGYEIAIPEPSSVLILLGLTSLVAARRRAA